MRSTAIIILMIFCTLQVFAQKDTLVMKNGDMLVGKIKELSKAVMKMETDYSDEDFSIEWNKVGEIYTHNVFFISLTDGRRINARFSTDPTDSSKVLIFDSSGILSAKRMEIVMLKEVGQSLLGRLDASFGLGLTITTENKLKQLNTRGNIGYTGRFWRSNASLDAIRGVQQDSVSIRRTDAAVGGMFMLQGSWFLSVTANFLRSDEQKLQLRSTTDISGGNLIVNTNRMYFATSAGLAWNNEEFTDTSYVRNSMEGKGGIELNLFDIKDFSLITNAFVYPSFTQKGRIRLDFKIDLKYDLPMDFYIKLGYTHNFDNQPAEGASPHFFKFDTTIGWEL